MEVRLSTFNLKEIIINCILLIPLIWVIIMLSFQLLISFLFFSGNHKSIDVILFNLQNGFEYFFDNTTNENMVIQDNEIWVESVVNNVKMGNLAGNRNLEFGVRNILEEYLQEKNIDLNPNSINKLKVEIIYLDVLSTKKNVSVFHKNEEEVIIRMKGTIYNGTKKIKESIVEGSSSEISMSTLIVDEGGEFNQTSLSNALKKTCEDLINVLNK